MPRLLAQWLQIHTNVGQTGRVQLGGLGIAADSQNFNVARAYSPSELDLDLDQLNSLLDANPAHSVDEFFARALTLAAQATGLQVSAQLAPPPPEPPVESATAPTP